jgi:predicted permease
MALFDWLRRRREIEADVDEEIRSHLAMATRERIAEGVDQQTARYAALKEFGNVTLRIEEGRRVWSSRWMDAAGDLWKDARHAARVLAKSPAFSLIVIAVLAVGIGMNTMVFTLFKSLALKPLGGVEGSGRLRVVMAKTSGGRLDGLSYPDYRYIRDRDSAFAGLSGSCPTPLSLGLGRGAERVWGELVTGNYFQLFGVRARLGRTLLPSDEVAPGKHPVVVLSDGLWRRAFGGDPNIVGKTVHLNGYPMTVVGVADATFHGSIVSFDGEVYIPIMMAPQLGIAFRTQPGELLHDRKTPLLIAYGRLRPGVTLAMASVQTAVLSEQLAKDAPVQDFSQQVTVLPIWRSPWGAQTYMLPAVIAAGVMGALLLLIVCANVAGLVLVRGIARRGEIAVRLALGASRARILRLLLIENLMLAAPGAAAGLLLAWYALPLMGSRAAASAPARLFFDMSVDWLVIGFAVSAAFASALVCGFVPALRSSRANLISVIKDDVSARGSGKGRFRAALVVSQVAVSLLLLVGAGLVARSLDAARHADPGFDARNVISMTMDLQPNGYDETRGRTFYQQLLDNMRRTEGIDSASLAAVFPMTMVDSASQKVVVEGYHPRRDEDLVFLYNVVTDDYFRTLRIGIETGREFARHDDRSVEQVAIVNDTLARRFWGSPQNAIGKRLRAGSGEWRTIIGVARDVKYARINENPRPYVYLPFLQSPRSSMILHARGSAGPLTLLDQARREVHKLDPDLPVLDAKALSDQTSAALGVFEITARILLALGLVAMGLSAMGLYGLVSYAAKQCTHEIGIRLALGANRRDVVRRFLGRGLRLGTIGAALGIGASYALTRLFASLLYGVSATDAVSFAAASVLVLVSVLLAAGVPAWRAARTDPMAALRYE